MERNTVTEDDDEILKDGERRRVPMYLRDGWRNDMHAQLIDDTYLGRVIRDTRTDAQKKLVQDAYRAADETAANAWRKGMDVGEEPMLDAQQQAALDRLEHAADAAADAFRDSLFGTRNDSSTDLREAAYRQYDDESSRAYLKGRE